MAHIVILGAGLGGMTMAYEMKEHARAQDKVTVISNHSFFQFTPSNPWVAVNWRTRDDITIPVAPYLEKKGIGFIPVGAQRLHPDKNQVELEDGKTIDYDYLIIATGPKLAFDEVEGLGPEGHTQSVCHVDHAVQAGKAWEHFIKDPGPVVVGAVQGASCYGPAYEFAFIMDTDLRRRKIRDKVPMTYVTAEPYPGHLGLGGVGDSQGMLESALRHRHIKWICNAKVTKVEAGKMFVSEHNAKGEVIKEHELPFKHSMMLPAFKGIDAVYGIEGLTNPRGFITIDPYQRNAKFKNVFSVGVCVAIPPVEATPVPTGAPKTGYMIETMVTATAHNIRALLDGKEPDQKATWNALCLADFGDTGAAFVALPQIPPRNVNWFKEGKWVHLAKIAFEKYFIRKMKSGNTEPLYEKYMLGVLGIKKLK
ncbi:MAG: pyridine nucleotide-disulfide oxidoreductase [Hydrogenophilales bacterium CG03_land_8_20_14_0_80_62_28]|nr:NAD(P)/FAD-dependent oxidoreductase [Betaproteobacteria bacterium]OIO77156.1 MAG: pyridine nucleotide-disulfide oxidoreductase [Hydrogenophilaceae bacterium CG1_02_62_390]PIV22541.1 MAG: pyridine nucleotide-disulfide oxidoreductase [Hydrogenophilales bacterium CG03_land_8_20_14_0_80_62_28]PIW38298.1 MAG: pyridine nucleotide-disulfide oxidoreductase [Hydrogenophilales bacterium CG15_BIG_FIL_POST_REV_8_21_14_020_62_31]PIW72167.1 MAG: pyridine nucleotide-disulfide oxidoreductase [Hydrogenophila